MNTPSLIVDCARCDEWQADYTALLFDKKQLLQALIEIRQISGCALDFGNNDDAVHKCYLVSKEAIGESCMSEIVKECEKMGAY